MKLLLPTIKLEKVEETDTLGKTTSTEFSFPTTILLNVTKNYVMLKLTLFGFGIFKIWRLNNEKTDDVRLG